MRFLLALLAAVAMVAGSLFLRDRLDDDDNGSGGGDDGGPVELVCVTELAPVCRGLRDEVDFDLRVTVEDAGATADRLVAGPSDLDGWLTIAPWPAIVSEARARAATGPALGETHRTAGRSPLVLVAVRQRAEVLAPRCPNRVLDWRCIGDAAGRPWPDVGGEPTWGDVRPGHPPADATAAGLAAAGQAVVSYFGQRGISSAEFEDDAFLAWFTRLERSVPHFRPRARSLVEDMLLTPGTFDVVGALEAEARPLLARSPGGQRLAILYPATVVTADVVLALPAGSGSESLVDAVTGSAGREALERAGWRVTPGQPPLPDGDGLPEPGVLDALRSIWRDLQ